MTEQERSLESATDHVSRIIAARYEERDTLMDIMATDYIQDRYGIALHQKEEAPLIIRNTYEMITIKGSDNTIVKHIMRNKEARIPVFIVDTVHQDQDTPCIDFYSPYQPREGNETYTLPTFLYAELWKTPGDNPLCHI